MQDEDKSKKQLIQEIKELRSQEAEWETAKIQHNKVDNITRESNDFFENIFNSTLDGILISDSCGRIKRANKAIQKMLAYSEKEMIGKHPMDFLPVREYTKEHMRLMQKLIDDGHVSGFEAKWIDKKGNSVFVDFNISTLNDNQGRMVGAVGAARDITKRKYTEELLKKSKEDLRARTENLEEVNTALKVLLKKREEDKTELGEKVQSNVKRLIEPYLEKLKMVCSNCKQKTYLEILESNLKDIVSPFASSISSSAFGLTVSEIQVAGLIKDGRTTKEIAELLNLSSRTIEFHRRNIREKLGLRNTKTSLRAYLAYMH